MKKQKENKQKGITLIALIITIIVMLILVGVSVSVALNGGLFKTAKEASKGTETKRDEELALSEGKVKIDGEWYNSIEEYVNKQNIPEELKKYVLGSDLAGRSISEIYSSNKFKDDEATADEDETQTVPIEYMVLGRNEDNTEIFIYGKYNNTVYRIAYNQDTKVTIPEKTKAIYTPTGREGQDLGTVTGDSKYDGWTILYDYGNKVEAVAPFTSDGTLTLGSGDIDEAIESYNNAITLINDYVKADTTTYNNGNKITYYTQDGTTKGVRSVGAGEDPTGDEEVYTSSKLEEWNSKYNGVGKKGDISYEQDIVRMAFHECFVIDAHWWVASRHVGVDSDDDVYYYCYNVPRGDGLAAFYLWHSPADGTAWTFGNIYLAVRPVITLENL